MINFFRNKLILIIVILFLLSRVILILSYNDTGWEPDSYQHFNELRTVYSDFPNNLVLGLGVWSKPLYTFLFGVPVELTNGGLALVQFINSLIFAATIFLSFKITRFITKSHFYSLLTAIFISLSLTLTISSTSALTEPVFLLFLMIGWFLSFKQKYTLAGLVLGLSILGRIEGLFFLGIFNLWLIYVFKDNLKVDFLKILKIWVLSVIPLLTWNLLGFLNTGNIFYVLGEGYPSTSENIFGTGSVFYYPFRFLMQEPIIFVLSLLSFVSFKYFKFNKELWLIYISAFGFITTQIITWRFGLLGSAGLMRYFVSVLPIMSILASVFVFWSVRKILPNYQSIRLKIFLIISIITITMIFNFVQIIGINQIDSKWINIEDENLRLAGVWIKENLPNACNLVSDRPEPIYYSGKNLSCFENGFASLDSYDYYVFSESWHGIYTDLSREELSERYKVAKEFGDSVVIYEI